MSAARRYDEAIAKVSGFLHLYLLGLFVPTYQGEFLNWHDYQCFYCIGDYFTIVEQELEILPILDSLDAGEKQAIQLAYNLQLPLLIEEENERKIAQELGIKFSGIAGQILKANRENLMTAEDSRKKLGELGVA